MTPVFRPQISSYLLPCSDSVNGFDFSPGDYPDAVLVTNTDTGNAVVVSVYSDTGGATYAAYPTVSNDYQGHGFVVQPSTAVVVAVNTAFSANTAVQMAGTAQCAAGLTATVLFNSGALE